MKAGAAAGVVVPVSLGLATLLAEVPERAEQGVEPPRAIAYFDWDRYPEQRRTRFGEPSNEAYQRLWVNRQDLQQAGLLLEDVCRDPRWYDAAFGAARRAGFDVIAWETVASRGAASPTRPTRAAVDAMRRHGLRVAPLLDVEISHVKVAELSETPYLSPDPEAAAVVSAVAASFRDDFPRDLWLRDGDRPVAFVFCHGFPRDPGPAPWDAFWAETRRGLEAALGPRPLVYWTRSATAGFLHARIHEGTWVRPFTFLAGGQQGPECITTSFWFDSAGAARRDGVTRVTRSDPRMVSDVRALLQARRPAMVFHYGLNEMLEGADILPWNPEGGRRAALLRQLLKEKPMGKPERDVLVVVDDLCHRGAPEPFPRRTWIDAERVMVEDVLPALLPFHRLATPGDAAVAAGDVERVVVLAYPGSPLALPPGAMVIDVGRELGAEAGVRLEEAPLRALLESRLGLKARPTYVHGRPEAGRENAVHVASGGAVRRLQYVGSTFLPPAAGHPLTGEARP